MVRTIERDELEPLATGAWILGTGGGGSPVSLSTSTCAGSTRRHAGCADGPAELADDDLVAVVSNMGAPLVGQERFADPTSPPARVRMMEEYLGRKFRAVMSVEIGGGNAFQPLSWPRRIRFAGGGCRRDGPRLPRGADDQLRHRRAADVPAHAWPTSATTR